MKLRLPATTAARETASLFESFEALQEKQPPLTFLVEGLVETPSTVLFFGPSGGGKTSVAVDLSGANTTGGEWYGGRKVTRGLVFYIAQEGRRGLLRRFQAWQLAHNVQIPPGRLFISTQRIEIDEDGAAALDAEIERRAVECDAAPTLIIVDTVARALPSGADENSARDMGAFVNVMDGIRDRFQCVVVLVHHSGHPDNKRTSGRARGSSSLRAAMDAELSISKSGGGFKAEWTKLKDLPDEPAPLAFVLESEDVGMDDAGKPVTSAAVVWRGAGGVRREDMTEVEKIGWRALVDANQKKGGPVTMKTWAETAARTAWGKDQRNPRARISAFGQDLARKGWAEKGDDDLWTAVLKPKTGAASGAPEVPEKRPNGQIEKPHQRPLPEVPDPPKRGAGVRAGGRGVGKTGGKMTPPGQPFTTGKKNRRQP